MKISKQNLKKIIIEEINNIKTDTVNKDVGNITYTAKISPMNFLRLTLTKQQFEPLNNFLKQLKTLKVKSLEEIKKLYDNSFNQSNELITKSGGKTFSNIADELIWRTIKNYDSYYNPASSLYASSKSNTDTENDYFLTISGRAYPFVTVHQGRGRSLRTVFETIINGKNPEKIFVPINIKMSSDSVYPLEFYFEEDKSGKANLMGQGKFNEVNSIFLKDLKDLKRN